MSVTVVHDYYFKPDSDVNEGKAAAAEFVEYLETIPEVQFTLWLEDRENPLHHFHINTFDSVDDLFKVKDSSEVKRFTDRLYPLTARATHTAPVCDVWLGQGRGMKKVEFT